MRLRTGLLIWPHAVSFVVLMRFMSRLPKHSINRSSLWIRRSWIDHRGSWEPRRPLIGCITSQAGRSVRFDRPSATAPPFAAGKRILEVDMTTSFPCSRFRSTLAAGVSLLLACAAALAADPGRLPQVVVIATGGTIAGVAASSTEFTDYKSAKVGIQALIEAIPGLRQVANVRGEQLF